MNRIIRKLLYLGNYCTNLDSYSLLNRRYSDSNPIRFKFEINHRFNF